MTNRCMLRVFSFGIMPKKISDSQKGSYYSKVFPINDKSFSRDTLQQIELFADRISNVKETNLLEYVEYCLGLLEHL